MAPRLGHRRPSHRLFGQCPRHRSPTSVGLRAIGPDQRGYAATTRPTAVDQESVDHLVADVRGIGDGLGVDRLHLVGHDWGGIVGWALASSYPERLHSLTSMSVPHPRAWRRKGPTWRRPSPLMNQASVS
ncbi:MAG: alpha/beta hydrolase [Actinobacteria bacterium]|nr:alpha/beta hydrolase [Actinomycetota bacterium]